MKLSPRCMVFCLVFPFLSACSQVHSLSFAPAIPGYGEESARYINLPKQLQEVSGLAYYDNKELLAINDEEGNIFFVNSETGKIRTRSFGKKGDYEDIVYTPQNWYVLKSNGYVYQVDPAGAQETVVFKNKFGKGYEFESLCYDAAGDRLLLVCKTCGVDAQVVNGWWIDRNTGMLSPEPAFSLSLKEIRKMAKDDTVSFEPSAVAFHPVTNQLFIIASVGKILLVCDKNGRPFRCTA
ncbi:MAG: SdiA-regulated domain-containing protein [Flavihumibacter sp.]